MKKVIGIIDKILEEYLPALVFVVLFLVFIAEIVCRYLLGFSIKASQELVTMCYTWVALLGACLAMRECSHVSFTLFYENFGEKGQRVSRIVKNIILIGAFAILFMPTVEHISFLQIKKTSVLKIPFSIVYLPFVWFMIKTIYHSAIELIKDTIKYKKTSQLN